MVWNQSTKKTLKKMAYKVGNRWLEKFLMDQHQHLQCKFSSNGYGCNLKCSRAVVVPNIKSPKFLGLVKCIHKYCFNVHAYCLGFITVIYSRKVLKPFFINGVQSWVIRRSMFTFPLKVNEKNTFYCLREEQDIGGQGETTVARVI